MRPPAFLTLWSLPASIFSEATLTNTAAVFLPFKEFSERSAADAKMPAILATMNARVRAEIPEAFVAVFPPPPVSGIGNAGGYRLFIQDRGTPGWKRCKPRPSR